MSDKFDRKYSNESLRLRNWNYGSDAAYFITICTKDRVHFFGEIQNNHMQVSPAGAIAHVLWHEIKNHAKNIELGEFVVMPNHIHGILILDGNNRYNGGDGICGDVACNVPTDKTDKTNNEIALPKTKKWPPFHQNQIQFRPSSVPTNRPSQTIVTNWDCRLHGNRVFMITSSGMMNRFNEFQHI